jgi:thiol:disulfide interchange protein DsbD
MDAEKLKAWSRSGSRILFGSLLLSCAVQAQAPLLPPDQAFPFTAISSSGKFLKIIIFISIW